MTLAFVFAIAVLAAARITRLVTTDSITMDLRVKAIVKFGEDSKVATLVQCPWCIGFWVCSAVTTAALLWPHKPLLIPLACFAASQIVGLLAQLDRG